MKNKKQDTLMYLLGVALLIVTVFSVRDTVIENVFESKKVGSISEITVPEVPDVTTERAFGVVSAEEWAPYYGDIYASWKDNEGNTGHGGSRISYVETNPDIKTIYAGYGFAYDYTEAIGHNYTLKDIEETTRPHKLANCLTCKTPDMTAMVNALGTSVYSMDFDEVYAKMSEPVSCYTCHANTPGTIVITHDYMRSAMADEVEAGQVSASSVSCAQCHTEYYFDPETKATLVPYTDLEEISPDAMIAYYDALGFSDFSNAVSGVGVIKAQHPEFETYYGKGSVHKGTYNCADCHMGVAYNKKGDPYASHYLASPLENKELIQNTCSQCHSDLEKMVKSIQTEVTDKENEVSAILVKLHEEIAAHEGKLSSEKMEEVKLLARHAQFYWDFVFVENSEGAHNSQLSLECLAKAKSMANKALEMLK